jgi:hypothetical protein
MGMYERTTYRAAKHAINATSFAPSFLRMGILCIHLCEV